MRETEIGERAKEAYMDDDFELSTTLYSKAIELNPLNPNFFADRAQAHLKLLHFTEAVADANRAIELDPSMSKAYLRKGIACMKLEEYHTAKVALQMGASLAQDGQRFAKLIEECDQHIAEESNELEMPLTPSLPPSVAPQTVASTQTNAVSLAKPKYRHEYYQKPEEVVVTIFAKGVPAQYVTVDFGEQILTVTIDVPSEYPYQLQTRLFAKILPDKCKYQVLSTKIEIRLAKAEFINWPSLEFRKEIAVPQKVNVPSVGSQRPAYPSSKSRTKDWDKLEAEVKKEEKEEILDGDAGVNKLFQDIYRNADEDTRRAMMKSFVESNGTVLSTDWKDVGSKKIETSAPDGVKLKKW